jgi:hypothetical protein
MYAPPASLLQRHRAFWRLEDVDQPLVGVYLGGYLVNDIYQVAKEDSILLPDQMIPQKFFDLFWQYHLNLQKVDQDLIYPVQPLSSVPWLEGMLGCTVHVMAQSAWAEPVLEKNEPLERFEPQECAAWMHAAESSLLGLRDYFTFLGTPTAGPFLRGPADVVAALIGAERLCIELIESPDQIRRLALFCAQAWIRASQQLISSIPAWHEGYVLGARWIFAPGPCTYASEDITSIFSPKVYKDIFLPVDKLMATHFPYGFMHRHSASMHHLEALLELPSGWAIEVTMDPTGPQVRDILPVLKRIQAAGRPLIVFGLNDSAEIEELATELSPRGLCITVQADTPEQASSLVNSARRKTLKAPSTV